MEQITFPQLGAPTRAGKLALAAGAGGLASWYLLSTPGKMLVTVGLLGVAGLVVYGLTRDKQKGN